MQQSSGGGSMDWLEQERAKILGASKGSAPSPQYADDPYVAERQAIIDGTHDTYMHDQGNKQYSNRMKMAYESNPDSFKWQGPSDEELARHRSTPTQMIEPPTTFDPSAPNKYGMLPDRAGDFADDGIFNAIDRLIGAPKGTVGQPSRWITEGIAKGFDGVKSFRDGVSFDDWKSGNIYQDGTDIGAAMRANNPLPSTGNKTVDKVGTAVGDFIAPMVGTMGSGISAIPSFVDGALTRSGVQFGEGIGGQAARGLVDGAISGYPMNAAVRLTYGDPSMGDVARAGNEGVLLGAPLGAAGGALKGAISSFMSRLPKRGAGAANDAVGAQAMPPYEDSALGAAMHRARHDELLAENNMRARTNGTDEELPDIWNSIKQPHEPDYAELQRRAFWQEPQRPTAAPEAPPQSAMPMPEAAQEMPRLPRDLAGARPRYGRGRESWQTQFQSDVDKALYIVARTANRSARDGDYMQFLRQALPHLDDAGIRAEGVKVRESLKGHSDTARAAGTAHLDVPDSGIWRRTAPEAPPQPHMGARSSEEAAALREIQSGADQTTAARPEASNQTRESQFFRNNPDYAAVDGITTTYKKQLNPELVAQAKKFVSENPDRAYATVMRMDGDGKYPPVSGEILTTGHELIDALTRAGKGEQAALVIARLASGLRESARGMQANQMYTKFTRSGAELQGYNIKNAGVKSESQMKPLTPAESANIGRNVDAFQAANTTAERASTLLDVSRQKAPLSGDQASKMNVIRQASGLVRDAKMKELEARKTPQRGEGTPSEPREHKLLDKLKASADQAEKELRARKNDLSSNPVDVYGKYLRIATYHVARKVTNFADFSAEMLTKIGAEVKPHLERLYTDAVTRNLTKELKKLNDFDKALQESIDSGMITPQNATTLRALSRELAQESNVIRTEALGSLQKAFSDLAKPDFLDKMGAYTAINMLLNTGTIERNVLGNGLMAAQESVIRHLFAGPIDAAWAGAKKMMGKEAERQFYFRTGVKGELLKNWFKGGRYGWQGKDPNALAGDLAGGLRFAQSSAIIKNTLGYLERALHAANKSFDYAAAQFAINKEMGRLAAIEVKRLDPSLKGPEFREAIKDYIQINLADMMDGAKKYGEFMTFQDSNIFSKASIGIKRGLNFGKGYGLGDVVNKFAQTSGSLIARFVDYSPLGVVKAVGQLTHLIRNSEKVINGEITRHDFLMQGGRVVLGSVLGSGLSWKLSELGVLTGAASDSPKINNMRESMGMSPYSANLSGIVRWFSSKFDDKAAAPQKGDYIVNYGFLQPIAATVGVASTIQSASAEHDSLWKGIDRSASALMDISFLQGLHRAFDTSNGQGVLAKTAGMIAGVPATYIPLASLLRQGRRLTDDNKREYTPATEDWLANARDQMLNTIPTQSERLDEKRDYLGKESKYYDGTNKMVNAAQSILSPSEIHTNGPSPAMQKAIADFGRYGDPKVLPSKADKSVTIRGNQVELSKDQYDRLRELIGQNTEDMVAKYAGKPETGSERARIERAAGILAGAREKARGQVIKEYGLNKK